MNVPTLFHSDFLLSQVLQCVPSLLIAVQRRHNVELVRLNVSAEWKVGVS